MDPSVSSSSSSVSAADQVVRRAAVIARHLWDSAGGMPSASPLLVSAACLHYSPPEVSEKAAFDSREMRRLMDGHDLEARDWLFRLMEESLLFCPRRRGGEKVFVAPDYNQTKEQQQEATMRRIEYLLDRGVFEGWLTGRGPEAEMRKFAFFECVGIYDHSLAIKLGVHFFLW